jgi:hypothetical protein
VQPENAAALIGLFPVLFIGMWLAVTSLLGVFSGWFELQSLYPNRDEQPLDSIWFVSGALGKGNLYNPWGNVSFGNCLRLEPCLAGLRVRVWRIFGMFQRPFFVPWPCITVEERRFVFFRYYRLEFDRTGGRALTIWGRAFNRLAKTGLIKLP